nr:hypothetical protein [Catelliglobosispora koreensis]
MMDPLAALLNLTDIADAATGARAAVDGAYKHPAMRRKGGLVAAEVSLRSAVASLSLEGTEYELAEVRSGTVLDPLVQGALRVAEAIPSLSERWQSAPRQVLAKLHVLAGTGVIPTADLGRPVVPLDQVVSYVTQGDPLIRAAVIHGELLALQAFPGVNGIIARAAARLTYVASGLDPRGVIPVEVVHASRAPEYVGASNAFATGTPDGIRSWLKHVTTAVALAAQETHQIASAV